MIKPAINDDVMRYLGCMDRVNKHLRIVEGLYSAPPQEGFDALTEELIWLHFRKALEELAFSSLSANVETYSRVHKKFALFWQAKKLLKEIGTINPDFYPLPLNENGRPYLTRDDFSLLYSQSSNALHSRNPYKPDTAEEAKLSVAEWIERFRNLLHVHSIRLLDNEEIWTVIVPHCGSAHLGVSRLVNVSDLTANKT